MILKKSSLVFHKSFKDEVFKTLEDCDYLEECPYGSESSIYLECVSEGEHYEIGEKTSRYIQYLKKVEISDFHKMSSELSKRMFFKQFKNDFKKTEDILNEWI